MVFVVREVGGKELDYFGVDGNDFVSDKLSDVFTEVEVVEMF